MHEVRGLIAEATNAMHRMKMLYGNITRTSNESPSRSKPLTGDCPIASDLGILLTDYCLKLL